MKVFCVLLAFAVMALADHHEGHTHYVVKTHDDLVKFRDECGTKLNIPTDLMTKYKSWEYPDNETTHCYMKCVFEKFGFFDEHKGFDVEMVHHQLVGAEGTVDHNDELHQKVIKCADKNTEGSDACTWAYRGGMCFIRNHLNLVKKSVEEHHH